MKAYDAIVVGAGMAGLYQLHMLRQIGMNVRVFEAGSDVGGTWYWNRYPGCRFDSETYSYCYSFSDELLKEWNWTEHFAPQPETLRYLNFVADKFDLRKDIEFNTRIVRATWDNDDESWTIETEDGRRAKGRYLITALGPLSIPLTPSIPGLETFEGRSFHSADWPRDPFDLRGKRVAVIGTGATGVQIIQTIAKDVAQLTVYQREGNWTSPLRNSKIDPAEMQRIKDDYPNIFARCKATDACFLHQADPRGTFDVSEEEREAFYEQLYQRGGFASWLGNFHDLFTDDRAAKTFSVFMARKIRERVKDPKVADMLTPKGHPFGAKRVPMETDYYEAYNRENVELVDIKASPIERITPKGIVTGGVERPFDVIIFATGFYAFRGGYDRIDFRGNEGQTLADKWAEGPQTYLGLMIRGFPNLFTVVGPHNGGTFCNVPRCIEQNVEFITKILSDMRAGGYGRIEPIQEFEDRWTADGEVRAAGFVPARYDSWFSASNVPGRKKKVFLLYAMPQPEFRALCADIVSEGYRGFERSQAAGHAPA